MRRVPTPARTTLLDGAPPTPAGRAIPASAAPPQPSPGTPRPPGTRSIWPGTGPGGGRTGKGANALACVVEQTAAQGATAAAWTGTGAPRRTTAMWSARSRRRSCRKRPMPRDLWRTRQVVARTRVVENDGRQQAGAPPRARTKWDAPYLRGPCRGRQASGFMRDEASVASYDTEDSHDDQWPSAGRSATDEDGRALSVSSRATSRASSAEGFSGDEASVVSYDTEGSHDKQGPSAGRSAAEDDDRRGRSGSSRSTSRASSAASFTGDDASATSYDLEESRGEHVSRRERRR